ncbi:polysaccharide deacetylase family protein [Candidatus Saccharibacteria bacterium]|nr:polysaccharide deacetylase family protein [Candidatus Saccharibacteria bacterium]
MPAKKHPASKSKSKKSKSRGSAKGRGQHLSLWLTLLSIAMVILYAAAIGFVYYRAHAIARSQAASSVRLNAQANALQQRLELFRKLATQSNLSLDDQSSSEQKIQQTGDLIKQRKYLQAYNQINQAKLSLGSAQIEFAKALYARQQPNKPVAAANSPTKSVLLPILFYHKPPADFDSQMNQLAAKGYTTVSMAEAAKIISGEMTSPPKPAVITFDDGFSAQQAAMPSLIKHHFKATLYLITAGERSNWCIGVERRPGNCGDSYLNWNQIRQALATGLIEIGNHTADHSNLPVLNAELQTFEIVSAKQKLEAMLGVPITTLAYPYGSFNGTTIDAVRKAGFSTAVTTISGLYQTPENIFTLRRVRNVSQLP